MMLAHRKPIMEMTEQEQKEAFRQHQRVTEERHYMENLRGLLHATPGGMTLNELSSALGMTLRQLNAAFAYFEEFVTPVIVSTAPAQLVYVHNCYYGDLQRFIWPEDTLFAEELPIPPIITPEQRAAIGICRDLRPQANDWCANPVPTVK